MLSYRHSFHAGNFADVLKHIVLVDVLDHLSQKETAFEYIDTHAGAGLFNLKSNDARKLQEHADGIGKLKAKDFPGLERYFEVVHSCSKPGALDFYPGSPAIAKYFLRPQDRAWMFELHPRDYESLRNNMRGRKKIRVFCEDGLKGMAALLPPVSRRGLVLIDSAYEVKSDYEQVVDCVIKAQKKFRSGVYAIWYPVVDQRKIDKLVSRFTLSGIRNIQRFELGISTDTNVRGMNSAGMIVINPPWKLFEKMSNALPRLVRALGGTSDHLYKCDVIVDE